MRLFFAEIVPKTLVSSCFGVNFIVGKKISWDIFGKYNSVYVYKELSAAGVANQVLVLQISDKRRVCVKACGFDKNSTDFEVGKIEVVRKI